jgi:hypothetical protein
MATRALVCARAGVDSEWFQVTEFARDAVRGGTIRSDGSARAVPVGNHSGIGREPSPELSERPRFHRADPMAGHWEPLARRGRVRSSY